MKKLMLCFMFFTTIANAQTNLQLSIPDSLVNENPLEDIESLAFAGLPSDLQKIIEQEKNSLVLLKINR